MTHPQDLSRSGPEWLERIRQGDQAAFESLFRAFAPGLCAFTTRYVDSPQVAEEIVQDLFLAVWQKRGSASRSGQHVDPAAITRDLHRLGAVPPAGLAAVLVVDMEIVGEPCSRFPITSRPAG